MTQYIAPLLVGIFILFSLSPETIDQTQSAWSYLSSFLFFIFFFFSTLGWGGWIRKKFLTVSNDPFLELVFNLLIGSVCFAWLGGMLSLVTLNPYVYAPILLVGFVIADFSSFSFLRFRKPIPILTAVLSSVLVLSVILRIIESATLQRQGDPLICYLTANRSLIDYGGFAEFVDNPTLFLSSSWESLYLWGFLFFAKAPHVGLASGQRFAQWCVSAIGYLGMMGVSFLLIRDLLLRTLTEASAKTKTHITQFALIGAISVGAIPTFRWLENIAKNDIGIVFWLLGATYFLLFSTKSSKKVWPFFVGLLVGSAVIGKITSATFGIVALVLLLAMRVPASSWMVMAGGGLVGLLPICLRNFIYAHNPLFPWALNKFFGADMMWGPSQRRSVMNVEALTKLPFSFNFFIDPFLEHPWTIVAIPFFAWLCFNKKIRAKSPLLFWFFTATLLHIVFYAFILGRQRNPRYFASGIALVDISFVVAVAYITLTFSKLKEKSRNNLTWGVALFTLAISNLPLFTLKQMFGYKYRPGDARIREHIAGKAKHWLRTNHPNEGTVALQDHEIYYMVGYRYIEPSYSKKMDELLESFSPEPGVIPPDAVKIVEELKRQNYRFVMDARKVMEWGGEITEDSLASYLEKFPTCIAYTDDEVRIYDIANCKF